MMDNAASNGLMWAFLCLNTALLALLLWRVLRANQADPLAHQEQAVALQAKLDRIERELRFEIAESSRGGRQELAQTLAQQQQALLTNSAQQQQNQLQQLSLMQKSLTDTLNHQLQQLQKSNADKLDEMRRTVDEKLQTTLEKRLSESFKQVAERLEQVHNGLGQMQKLADGVGSLQRVLTNVKTRGMFGEVQLEALLEQVLTIEQYGKQVETKPRSNQRVDFAIRFPGRGGADGEPVWLPIDAKFPREDYERLLDAQDRADALGAEVAAKALEVRIRTEAKSIAESYLAPPYTTDFAILFLPTEGLYAEVLRRPGLMDSLQRDYRVSLAGPTTLLAMLNSLHMGFRTLALEQQASEVWKVLGAVKTEFERYGDWVEKVREQVQKAADTLDKADTRSRQMRRALKNVEALPEGEAQALLPGVNEALDDTDAAS
jgi:DNA recombination protein RmuC